MSKSDKRRVRDFVLSSVKQPPERAIDAVVERRLVKLYCRQDDNVVELYVFYGKDRGYVLIPGIFCSCKDFELNVVLRGLKGACYHLVSLELARNQGRLKVLEVNCETLRTIALELILREDSATLRKIMHSQLPSK